MDLRFSHRIVALVAAYAIALNAVLAGLAIGAQAASAAAADLTVICGGDAGAPAFPTASHGFCPVGASCGLPNCAGCGAPGMAPQVPDGPHLATAVLFALSPVPDRAGSALAGCPQARAPPQA
jgi:hypothetical protein